MPAVAVTPRARRPRQLVHEPAGLLDARPWPWWCAPWRRGGATRSRAARVLASVSCQAACPRRNSSRRPEELAVAALGLEQAAGIDAAQLEHARGHVLEELAVVAHHEEGARALGRGASSSQRMPSRSRWLVGSSMSRTSGAATSSRAMARRFCQPPDRVSTPRAAVGEPGAAERPAPGGRAPVVVVDAAQRRGHHARRPSGRRRRRDPGAHSRSGCRRGGSAGRGPASRGRRES